jgi:hypothetical protein
MPRTPPTQIPPQRVMGRPCGAARIRAKRVKRIDLREDAELFLAYTQPARQVHTQYT